MNKIVVVIIVLMMLVGCSKEEVFSYEVIDHSMLTEQEMMLFSDHFQSPGAYVKEYNDMYYILLVGDEVNTGGYDLSIIESVLNETTLTFNVEVIPPASDMAVIQVLSNPTVMIKTANLIEQVNMEIK